MESLLKRAENIVKQDIRLPLFMQQSEYKKRYRGRDLSRAGNLRPKKGQNSRVLAFGSDQSISLKNQFKQYSGDPKSLKGIRYKARAVRDVDNPFRNNELAKMIDGEKIGSNAYKKQFKKSKKPKTHAKRRGRGAMDKNSKIFYSMNQKNRKKIKLENGENGEGSGAGIARKAKLNRSMAKVYNPTLGKLKKFEKRTSKMARKLNHFGGIALENQSINTPENDSQLSKVSKESYKSRNTKKSKISLFSKINERAMYLRRNTRSRFKEDMFTGMSEYWSIGKIILTRLEKREFFGCYKELIKLTKNGKLKSAFEYLQRIRLLRSQKMPDIHQKVFYGAVDRKVKETISEIFDAISVGEKFRGLHQASLETGGEEYNVVEQQVGGGGKEDEVVAPVEVSLTTEELIHQTQ